MVSAADLADVGFLADLPEWAREELARHSRRVRFGAGDIITRQHEKADTAHFLTDGTVEVLLRFEGTGDLLIGTITEAAPTLGWSAFRPPYRYTASIRCQGPCTTIAVPRQAFDELFGIDPGLEMPVLRSVAGVVADRLERTVDLLLGRPSAADDYIGGPVVAPQLHPDPAETEGPARGGLSDEILAVLEDAPFFEHFSRVELDALAERAHVADHAAGHHIVHLGAAADSFHMLVSGTARLVYTDEAPATPAEAFSSQTITEPGRVIGWSALVEPFRYRAGALAATRCRTLVFDHNDLLDLAAEHHGFGRRLMLQVLWLLGNRLRETRMRMVARRYDDEVLAIRALIDQSAEELRVTSPLHKLPLFLQNRVTVPDAIAAMELLAADGDEVERQLAVSALDLMVNIRKELHVYQRLQAIYEHVAGAAPGVPPALVRRRCSEEFAELFEETEYVITGLERLPDKPGHLVIMNHLSNDPSNAMPSGFHLTMDTHFVSSMILFRKYGRAPIRVIRKSSPDEYAHQMYYDRLGYIYVFRADVDPVAIAGGRNTQDRREAFRREAQGYLTRGENIVICPEGNSTSTEASPMPFKSGTFRLAAASDPEPLVIPISVANFDKRLTRTTLAATVHEPFRLSDHLPRDASDADLFAWVNEYQRTFSGYVRDTIALAARGPVGRS